MFGDGPELLQRVMMLIPMVLSLTVHEWAHARSAYALGDDTASMMGRMSLNPVVHIDIIGTIILPLLGVPFGWAKPVPVNPVRFSRKYSMRWGMMITALAGPASNIALALVSAILISAIQHGAPELVKSMPELFTFLMMMVYINIGLAVFNMIPVPPLDGSRLADYFMPPRFRPAWEAVYRGAPIALAVLIIGLQFFGGMLSAIIGVIGAALFALTGVR